MQYYKITYESDTVEGLKAIQGGFPGHESSDTDSATSKASMPAPPPKQIEENQDSLSGVVQAPPTANETGAGSDFSDKNSFFPPPGVSDSPTMDSGMEAEIPPPPTGELQDQEGNEA